VTVAVRLTVPGVGIGVVRLELPEGASVSPLGWEHRRARVNRLTVVARVEIAATNLAAADASSLSVGDAVVFEGMRPLSASAEHWDARLVVGRGVDQLVASVRIAADGTGTASEGFGREHQLTEEETMDSASTTVLAATPIEVVAELGRITLRGDEVLGLSPGAVLAVGARVRQVTVRVGGAAWAEGEIVDIEGELGVRITKLLVG
jgi:flagellar motor switch/type III secretory pathway protein FliN